MLHYSHNQRFAGWCVHQQSCNRALYSCVKSEVDGLQARTATPINHLHGCEQCMGVGGRGWGVVGVCSSMATHGLRMGVGMADVICRYTNATAPTGQVKYAAAGKLTKNPQWISIRFA